MSSQPLRLYQGKRERGKWLAFSKFNLIDAQGNLFHYMCYVIMCSSDLDSVRLF